MVLYANDGREWVKKTLLSICCSMNNNCVSGNKERVSLKILWTVSITCLRMPLSRLKDTVLGVRGAVLMGLWRWTPPRA